MGIDLTISVFTVRVLFLVFISISYNFTLYVYRNPWNLGNTPFPINFRSPLWVAELNAALCLVNRNEKNNYLIPPNGKRNPKPSRFQIKLICFKHSSTYLQIQGKILENSSLIKKITTERKISYYPKHLQNLLMHFRE